MIPCAFKLDKNPPGKITVTEARELLSERLNEVIRSTITGLAQEERLTEKERAEAIRRVKQAAKIADRLLDQKLTLMTSDS